MDGKQVINKSNPTGTGKYLDERGQYVTLPISSGIITGTINFNFGVQESDTVLATVSNANLTNANFKSFNYIPKKYLNTFLEDFFLNGLSFNIENIIDNTSFDLRATALKNAVGIYQIDYNIQH